MRVAIVQEHVDARRGGAETSVLEMAGRLAELGADVRVLCAGWPPEGVEVPCRGVVVRGATKAARTRSFVAGVDSLCRREAFDIVHAVTPCMSANVYQPRGGTYVETIRRSVEMTSSTAARWLKRLMRRLNFRQQYLLGVERRLLRRDCPPLVAAVSDYVRRQIAADYPSAADRVRVVFNGVDFEPLPPALAAAARRAARDRWDAPDDVPVVLFVAHNFKLKGLRELLRAAAVDLRARWRVVVLGRDRPEPYARMAEELGVTARVHFGGASMPMVNAYGGADVLAHPTWYDPCSRVVLEALSSGLPVVTTSFNGAAEVIEAGRTGFVLNSPADVSELAAAIEKCVTGDMRQNCADAAAGGLRERLSIRRHAQELLALYAEIVRGSAGTR